MATIQIYGVPPSPFTRAPRLAAREKGVNYELVPTRPGETAPINPLGKIPMMKHGAVRPVAERGLRFDGPDRSGRRHRPALRHHSGHRGEHPGAPKEF
jgi:hypothetical protein